MRISNLTPPAKQAFSLVELAIVLVILGLLAGGVLSGQSLIRAAELRSVISDSSRYSVAVMSFREKYLAFPGDMQNATQFWGSAGGASHTNDATCFAATASSSKAVCDGNGNGRLLLDDGVADGSAPEWFLGWKELANAGLIEGSYSGKQDGTNIRKALIKVNVPAGRMSNSGFTLMSLDSSNISSGWFPGRYDGFMVGAQNTDHETSLPLFKPEEAWNLDTKLDDGKPGTGIVRTFPGGAGTCITTDVASTTAYKLEATSIACPMFVAFSDPGN